MARQGIFEVITARSSQPSRAEAGWLVTYRTEITDRGLRALGSLTCGGRTVREQFDVGISDTGNFAVDIGTGSGVKVKFRHPMFEHHPQED